MVGDRGDTGRRSLRTLYLGHLWVRIRDRVRDRVRALALGHLAHEVPEATDLAALEELSHLDPLELLDKLLVEQGDEEVLG
jgi:hypothetical protein